MVLSHTHTPNVFIYIYLKNINIYISQTTDQIYKQEGGTEEALLRWRVGGAVTVDETQVFTYLIHII